MQDCLEGGDRRLAAFFEMVDTVKIIPMVAKSTMFAIAQNDPSLFSQSNPVEHLMSQRRLPSCLV